MMHFASLGIDSKKHAGLSKPDITATVTLRMGAFSFLIQVLEIESGLPQSAPLRPIVPNPIPTFFTFMLTYASYQIAVAGNGRCHVLQEAVILDLPPEGDVPAVGFPHSTASGISSFSHDVVDHVTR
jgi:hypothetical protein